MSNSIPTVSHTYQNHHIDSTRWDAFKPRADDIVISTSYKSGTTWMQEIVVQLVHHGRDVPSRDDVSPWLERNRRPLEEVLAELEQQTARRVIKSHLALDGLKYFPQVKYIIVARDARDVAMSMWNHYSNYTASFYRELNNSPRRIGPPLPHCPPTIHEFFQNWMTRGWFPWESEGYPFWGNLHHTQTWWNFRELANILLVHFADLLRDVRGEIARIAEFLEIAVTRESMETIVSRVTLEAMRNAEQEKDSGLVDSFQGGANTFFYKGTNGRWKDILGQGDLTLYHQAVTRVLTPDCAQWLEEGNAAS